MEAAASTWLLEQLLSEKVTELRKLSLIDAAMRNPNADLWQLKEYAKRDLFLATDQGAEIDGEMMMYGNIWSREMRYAKAGDKYAGHTHDHDHVTFLVRGSVRVQLEGFKPRTFAAPARIIMPAEREHQFIALEDDTLAFCIHAVRDDNGEPVTIYDDSNVVAFEEA